ncbi:MAG TPA: glycosyltransferase family 4 protein [Thermoanaerobaculia bacterium]|nr:glycosyltransferase family 4 protein [Thermoanaerobaculia bacterium]
MREIVFINRFFHPDRSATSQLLADLAFHLASKGWSVKVITSRQDYENPAAARPRQEKIRGVDVHRVWSTAYGRARLSGRLLDYLSFYLTSFLALFFRIKRGTIVVALTDPPLVSFPAAIATQLRGAVLVNWIHDLFPEVAEQLGVIKPRGVISRLLRGLRNHSLRIAFVNVVLGELMEVKVRKRGGATVVRPNWADGTSIAPSGPETNRLRVRLGLENAFVVGHAGNLGRAHDYRTLLGAIEELRSDLSIRFVISGSGALYERLEARVRSEGVENVIFLPYQPREMLGDLLGLPDVHLITLRRGLEGLIVPSKFYGIAAAGRPSIMIGADDGEIGTILAEHECGLTVQRGDVFALVAAIRSLASDRSMVEQMGRRARRLFDENFDIAIALEAWESIVETTRLETTDEDGEKRAAVRLRPSLRHLRLLAGSIVVLAISLFAFRAIPFPGSSPSAGWIPQGLKPPTDAVELARSLRTEPANWQVAHEIAGQALDFATDQRQALWRSAHAHTSQLAGQWPAVHLSYIRSGFFHWSELTADDRDSVLKATAALLRSPEYFTRLYPLVWQITHDLDFLRAHRPATPGTTALLRDLAVMHGDFKSYLALRGEVTKEREDELERRRSSRSPEAMLASIVSAREERGNDATIVRHLEHFATEPPAGTEVDPKALAHFVEYVLRNGLQPLSGLLEIDDEKLPLVMRARLAHAAGHYAKARELEKNRDPADHPSEWFHFYAERAMEEARNGNLIAAQQLLGRIAVREKNSLPALLAMEAVAETVGDTFRLGVVRETIRQQYAGEWLPPERWKGLCGAEICSRSADATLYLESPGTLPIAVRTVATDDVNPWLEIYVDDRLAAEGEVAQSRRFEIEIAAKGARRIELRLANPMTRNRERRRIEVIEP